VDAAARQLDEEQHVQASQPDGVHGQEVAGDDRRRLRAQELRPALLRPPATVRVRDPSGIAGLVQRGERRH
jgi:hypothetical protein